MTSSPYRAASAVADRPSYEPEPTALTDRERRVLLYLAVFGLGVPVVLTVAVLLLNSADPVTVRQFWFFVHLGSGIVIVHAFAGGITTLLARGTSRLREAVRLASTASLAVVSWITVLSGTWFVYPGYRAAPPPGADLDAYPQEYLLRGHLWLWHSFGMEWKEFMGWLTPILATAVAYVAYRYGGLVDRNARIRAVTVAFFAIAFLAAILAAALGAAINTVAPNDFLRN
jgi:hypothetical protein